MKLLEKGGLRRPYRVVTMDKAWYHKASEEKLPRFFFTDKLGMMQFCLGHKLVCVTVKDGTEQTASVAASFYAMGAVMMDIHGDEGAG